MKRLIKIFTTHIPCLFGFHTWETVPGDTEVICYRCEPIRFEVDRRAIKSNPLLIIRHKDGTKTDVFDFPFLLKDGDNLEYPIKSDDIKCSLGREL